jgi:hypothetical protein
VSDNSAQYAKLEQRVDGIEKSIGSLGHEIRNISMKLDGRARGGTMLEGRVNALEGSIEGVAKQITALANKIDERGRPPWVVIISDLGLCFYEASLRTCQPRSGLFLWTVAEWLWRIGRYGVLLTTKGRWGQTIGGPEEGGLKGSPFFVVSPVWHQVPGAELLLQNPHDAIAFQTSSMAELPPSLDDGYEWSRAHLALSRSGVVTPEIAACEAAWTQEFWGFGPAAERIRQAPGYP